MARTTFGKLVKALRESHNEVMEDIAKLLGASVPFMSDVENGRKNVPHWWITSLIEHYKLDTKQALLLTKAAFDSRTYLKIYLQDTSASQRNLVLKLFEVYNKIDDNQAKIILDCIKNTL